MQEMTIEEYAAYMGDSHEPFLSELFEQYPFLSGVTCVGQRVPQGDGTYVLESIRVVRPKEIS